MKRQVMGVERLRRSAGPNTESEESVEVSTSLPPRVDGPVRCVLMIRIREIQWASSTHIDHYWVRVAWWGESGLGALFRPFDGSRSQPVRSTARYLIRAGPKHFAAYLRDMDHLPIELLAAVNMTVIASGQFSVGPLAALPLVSAPPLHGTCTLKNKSGARIADVKYMLQIEPITGLHSPAIQQEKSEDTGSGKRGKSGIGSPGKPIKTAAEKASPGRVRFADEREANAAGRLEPAAEENFPPKDQSGGERLAAPAEEVPDSAAQLLDELIVRGEQLRHQLAAERDRETGDAFATHTSKGGAGAGLGGPPELVHLGPPAVSKNPDIRAMQLLLGQSEAPPVSGIDPDDEWVPSDREEHEVTELDDPLHDQSLLNSLFYKNPASAAKESEDSDTENADAQKDESKVKRSAPKAASPEKPGSASREGGELETASPSAAAATPTKSQVQPSAGIGGSAPPLVHMMLSVPFARGLEPTPDAFGVGSNPLIAAGGSGCSYFLSCKLFWLNDYLRSAPSRTATSTDPLASHPEFFFLQIVPMQMVPENLTRFRDSYLVLELWRRNPLASAGVARDRLYGLCRLPLHPFFISFRDTVIAESLLQAEYPVIAVDSAVPVTRPGGTPCGRLQVLLAMGTERQLLALKQLHSQQITAQQRAFVAELTAPPPSVPTSTAAGGKPLSAQRHREERTGASDSEEQSSSAAAPASTQRGRRRPEGRRGKRGGPRESSESQSQEEPPAPALPSSFRVHVIVECAKHVGTQYERALNRFVEPNTFVTWPFVRDDDAAAGGRTGRDIAQTPVCERDSSPRWYFEAEGRVPSELLQASAPDKCFVLRLWHRPLAGLSGHASASNVGSADTAFIDASSGPQPNDRVIGWVAVDLHPLAFGLQQIAGWYNVLDFVSGHSNAQLKLCVVPLDPHLIRQFKPLLMQPTYSSTRAGAARRSKTEPKARTGDDDATLRDDAEPRNPKASDTFGDEAIVRALSVPALPLALLPPRAQSSAAVATRNGERDRDREAGAPQERPLAVGLPVSSERLELDTLKALLAQNLTELDHITKQMRTRHLNPSSSVVAAAASSRFPGPTAAYPPLSAAGRVLLEQLESRAEADELYDAHSGPSTRRTDRSSPRRGAAAPGTAASASAGVPFGASASLDFDSSAELTRVSSDFELPDERSSSQRSPLRPLPAELNSGASTLRWDDEQQEASPRSSRKSSPRKHQHHERVPTYRSSSPPSNSGEALAVGSSTAQLQPFLSSHHPVSASAPMPIFKNLEGGSGDGDDLPQTRAPEEGERDEDEEGDGNGDDGESDTTQSRILNDDPHSYSEAPPVPPLETAAGARESDDDVELLDPLRPPAKEIRPPPAPETSDELETLRELEEARRLKERIERLLTQCAEERAATSARSPRAEPRLLADRATASPPPAPLSPNALTAAATTSSSTTTASPPIASPSSAPVISSNAGATSATSTTPSKLASFVSPTAPSIASPSAGLQPPNTSSPPSQVPSPSFSTALQSAAIATATDASIAQASTASSVAVIVVDRSSSVLPTPASPPPGAPSISATRRRLVEQFDADSDDGAQDDALYLSPTRGDRSVSHPSQSGDGYYQVASSEFRTSRPPPPPPPSASAVAAAVSTARYMEQLTRIEAAIQARSVPRKSPPSLSTAAPPATVGRAGHAASSAARQHQLALPDVARIEDIFYGGSRPSRTPPRAFLEPSQSHLHTAD